MKTIHSDFRQFCHTLLLNENDGNKVCDFYRKHIKVVGVKSPTEAKKKNIQAILRNYSNTSLLTVIDHFLDHERRGTLKELTLPYFEKCVENKFNELKNGIRKEPTKTVNEVTTYKKTKFIVKPKLLRQIKDPIDETIPYKDNFLFQCECGSVTLGVFAECQSCYAVFDFSFLEKESKLLS